LAAWVLVDEAKRPRFWATVWEGVLTSGKDGTTARHLANVERFYQASAQTLGGDSLDYVIATRDFQRLESCLTAYLASLQNDAARRRVDLSDPWQSALSFVTGVVRHLGTVETDEVHRVEARLKRIEALYSQLAPKKKKAAQPIRALPAIVVNELYEIFDPLSPRNPFKTESLKARNYLLFILYLDIGLRRGEALVLSASAIKSDHDLITGQEYRWINVTTLEGEDPRYLQPALKTEQSQRQLPVTSEMVDLFDGYVDNYRTHSRYGHLFISQKKASLAPQTVNDIFKLATLCLSPPARAALKARGWSKIPERDGPIDDEREGKRWISPHDLRHTAVVLRLKRYVDRGDEMEEALGKLRVFFGWSYKSTMPFHYARAYWQTDAADMADHRFERHVDALRELDRSLIERAI
jgi:integrase